MACLNMEWRDARDALLDRRGGLDALLDAFAVGGDEALAEARLEIYPHLDSGPPPPSDLWSVEEDRDDPDICWRWSGSDGPLQSSGPTGSRLRRAVRAPTRRRSVAHRRRARGAEHRAPGEAFSLMTQADLVCGGLR